ncbi:hypothetical protein PDIDSM_4352 [Penicillium digitatum]|nr:hypothetical protein PDIDSM_4352 [Penicillium digitatum]
MAPEAPADTAGPSSPPPQLPEGWLPQWEGVGRKWYYVQRTTGKSQWEIPTEPIVLTRQQHRRQWGQGYRRSQHHIQQAAVLEKWSPWHNGRRDVLRGGQAPLTPVHMGSLKIQHMGLPVYRVGIRIRRATPSGYERQLAADAAGYGPHGVVGQVNAVQSAFYGSQTHPGYQITGPHHMGQSISPSAWGNNPSAYQGHPSGYHMTQHAQSFQGFVANPAGLHGHQPPGLWSMTYNPQEQMARSTDGASDSQPLWQLETQQGHLNVAGEGVPMNLRSTNLPKPVIGSYSSNTNADPSSGEFSRHASNASLVREGQPYQTSVESFSNHSTHSMVDQGRFGQGQPNPRSHFQHTAMDPALQGFSPLQHVQRQYQQQHMIRKQLGSHQANLAHGHQQYNNPMAQLSFNQYGPQHQFGQAAGPRLFPKQLRCKFLTTNRFIIPSM